jgi:hypothetical protein
MVEQREVINTYIEKQKENWFMWQINSFLKTIGIEKWINSPFGWWDKINEYVDLYLNGWVEESKDDDSKDEDKETEDTSLNIKEGINEKIGWLKWSVQLLILETQLSLTCPYFSELKELLQIVKEDRIELEKLKKNIEAGLAFDADWTNSNSSSGNTKESWSNKLAYSGYENLKTIKDSSLEVTQDDIDYVSDNAKYVIDNLTIKWELAQIKEIKDKDWNLILDCTWSTPFINKQAAEDLIWFSLLFYKKTWRTFELSSAYRTIAHQKKLVKENANKRYTNPQGKKVYWVPTAQPWYSGHNLGYSIDIKNPAGSSSKIWWVSGLQKIAEMFDFKPISSEDWHFDHKIFVDNYYNDKEARPVIAENLDNNFNSSWAA